LPHYASLIVKLPLTAFLKTRTTNPQRSNWCKSLLVDPLFGHLFHRPESLTAKTE
jgi:hypothetical protein